MQVSQIYISDNKERPRFIASCIETIRQAAVGLEHHIYDGDELRSFIHDRFDSETVAAFDKLVPYAYKADLGRYCLLYSLGGWYADVSIRANMNLPVLDGIDALVFRDAPHPKLSTWGCSNALLFCRQGTPIYEKAIKYVLRNCAENYYGVTPLCPTGPTLLGRAFARLGANRKNLSGDLMALTPLHKNLNYAFVLPDGAILAYAKPTWGTPKSDGLGALGATGTNSYNDLYAKRQIYAS